MQMFLTHENLYWKKNTSAQNLEIKLKDNQEVM